MSEKQPLSNKYQLKSLHEEIDLYDRKIAHLDRYGSTSMDVERSKLVSKRKTLEKNARQLAADGVTFEASDLPRSFRDPVAEAGVAEDAEAV